MTLSALSALLVPVALLACGAGADVVTFGDGEAAARPSEAAAGCTGCDAGRGSVPAPPAAPPTPTDGIQNGTETDVDCGGDAAPQCGVGLGCKAAGDCTSLGCGYQGTCVATPSCAPHEGGDTCGKGEEGEPGRVHESCCTELDLPGTGTRLDKFVVTAGRMRAFVEATHGDLAGYIATHRPAWWDAEYGDTQLPTNLAEANFELSAQGATAECIIGEGVAGSGTRTYWLSDADNDATLSGRQGYTQKELDEKALNCVRRPMLAALCAFDGKRLSKVEELREAWGDGKYPWGNQEWDDNQLLAVHHRLYAYPAARPAFVADQSYQMAAPGRRPLGNGPLGHADVVGLLFEHTTGATTLAKGSFEMHEWKTYAATRGNFESDRKYGSIGGRCGRD